MRPNSKNKLTDSSSKRNSKPSSVCGMQPSSWRLAKRPGQRSSSKRRQPTRHDWPQTGTLGSLNSGRNSGASSQKTVCLSKRNSSGTRAGSRCIQLNDWLLPC